VKVQPDTQPEACGHRARAHARTFVADQAGQFVQSANRHGCVGGAVVLLRMAGQVRESDPLRQAAVAALCEGRVAQEFASQAGVGRVQHADVRVGHQHVKPDNLFQAQTDRVPHTLSQRGGQPLTMLDHHRDHRAEAELHRVQVLDDAVLRHPVKVAAMCRAGTPLLAGERGLEHPGGEADVLWRAVGDQAPSQTCSSARLVKAAILGHLHRQARLGVPVGRQWERRRGWFIVYHGMLLQARGDNRDHVTTSGLAFPP